MLWVHVLLLPFYWGLVCAVCAALVSSSYGQSPGTAPWVALLGVALATTALYLAFQQHAEEHRCVTVCVCARVCVCAPYDELCVCAVWTCMYVDSTCVFLLGHDNAFRSLSVECRGAHSRCVWFTTSLCVWLCAPCTHS